MAFETRTAAVNKVQQKRFTTVISRIGAMMVQPIQKAKYAGLGRADTKAGWTGHMPHRKFISAASRQSA